MSFQRIRKIHQPPIVTLAESKIQRIESTGSADISVIIPCAGDNFLRERNFRHCLACLNDQTYRNFEVIVVEQSLDGNFYKRWTTDAGMRWIGIKDPIDRGFNLSWCRNIGAKHAIGKKIVLMDSDMCFEDGYLERVSQDQNVFALGAKRYHWIRQEAVTRIYEHGKNFAGVYRYGNGGIKDGVQRFNTGENGNGYGAVLVFDRKWYLESFRGYCEDFFKYGWEDKAGIEIIKKILNINELDLPKIDFEIIHLSHGDKDYKNMGTNERIFNLVKSMDLNEWIDRTSLISLGDVSSPKIIFNDGF
jgi:glycosyltransferase involved in cell wall biosynthesis